MKLIPSIQALLVVASSAFAQTTFVVDAAMGSGADFPQIQPAIDAAAPGDVILVRKGTYDRFATAKGVTITADSGAKVEVWGGDVDPAASVGSLPATQTCVLRDLHLIGSFVPGWSSSDPLRISGCAGTVLVEGCELTRNPARVDSSEAVAFVRCDGSGHDGSSHPDLPYSASPAMTIDASTVFVYDSTFVGGEGGYTYAGIYNPAQDGDPAIEVSGASFLYLDGGSITGGHGGDAFAGYWTCTSPGNGGDGLVLLDGAPSAVVRATTLAGGTSGTVPAGCTPGQDGLPISAAPGQVTTLAGEGPRLAASSPVREGQVMDVVATGQPGDLGFVLFAPEFQPQYLPAFASALIVSPSTLVLPIGTFPAGGQIAAQPTVAPLPAGVEGLYFALQVAACDLGAGACLLGNPTAPVVLDSSL